MKRNKSLLLVPFVLIIALNTILIFGCSNRDNKEAIPKTYEYNEESCILTISGDGILGDIWPEYVKYYVKEIVISDESKFTEIAPYTFENFIKLESITIPKNIAKIGAGAFLNCNSLKSITIPEDVVQIGNMSFYNCSSLIEINFDSIVCEDFALHSNVFSGAGQDSEGITLNIGKNTTKIPNYFFSVESDIEHVNVKTINFNNNVTIIGDSAFKNCINLNKINDLPDKLTYLGDYAFAFCKNLTSVINVPVGVQEIKNSTFRSCSALKTINLSENLLKINEHAFSDCINLIDLIIPKSTTTIYSSALSGFSVIKNIFIPISVKYFLNPMGGYSYYKNINFYCEATSKPDNWDYLWDLNGNVYWGYSFEEYLTEINKN